MNLSKTTSALADGLLQQTPKSNPVRVLGLKPGETEHDAEKRRQKVQLLQSKMARK